jgi:hypothetical protein
MHHRVQVLGLGHPVASFPKFYAPFRRAAAKTQTKRRREYVDESLD